MLEPVRCNRSLHWSASLDVRVRETDIFFRREEKGRGKMEKDKAKEVIWKKKIPCCSKVPATCIKSDPKRSLVAIGYQDSMISLFEVAGNIYSVAKSFSLPAGEEDVTCLCFYSDFLLASCGSSIFRFDLKNSTLSELTHPCITDEINSIAVVEKCRLLALATDSGLAGVFSVENEGLELVHSVHHENICSGVCLEGGQLWSLGMVDLEVKVSELESGEVLAAFRYVDDLGSMNPAFGNCLAFSDDFLDIDPLNEEELLLEYCDDQEIDFGNGQKRFCAIGKGDGSITLIKISTGGEFKTIQNLSDARGHLWSVQAMYLLSI